MEKITIFEEKRDDVFYLRKGEKIGVNGTNFQFYYVGEGIIYAKSNVDNSDTVVVSNLVSNYIIPKNLVFLSKEEAETKAKELNRECLSKLTNTIEKNYLL